MNIAFTQPGFILAVKVMYFTPIPYCFKLTYIGGFRASEGDFARSVYCLSPSVTRIARSVTYSSRSVTKVACSVTYSSLSVTRVARSVTYSSSSVTQGTVSATRVATSVIKVSSLADNASAFLNNFLTQKINYHG